MGGRGERGRDGERDERRHYGTWRHMRKAGTQKGLVENRVSLVGVSLTECTKLYSDPNTHRHWDSGIGVA